MGKNGMSSGWICWRCKNVGEFVPFLLMMGEFSHFAHFLFQICCFHPFLFSISTTCRFHLLVDFVFTYSFFPFHILADFTYLQISSTCTCLNEDCFYCCSYRNNVVFLFGTLKVQSFMLTEVRDCALLIVVTSSTFLKMMMIAFIITLGEIM